MMISSKAILLYVSEKHFFFQGRTTSLPALSREIFTENSERPKERNVYYSKKHRKQSWQRHQLARTFDERWIQV